MPYKASTNFAPWADTIPLDMQTDGHSSPSINAYDNLKETVLKTYETNTYYSNLKLSTLGYVPTTTDSEDTTFPLIATNFYDNGDNILAVDIGDLSLTPSSTFYGTTPEVTATALITTTEISSSSYNRFHWALARSLIDLGYGSIRWTNKKTSSSISVTTSSNTVSGTDSSTSLMLSGILNMTGNYCYLNTTVLPNYFRTYVGIAYLPPNVSSKTIATGCQLRVTIESSACNCSTTGASSMTCDCSSTGSMGSVCYSASSSLCMTCQDCSNSNASTIISGINSCLAGTTCA